MEQNKYKILIVDDEPDVIEIVKRSLTRNEFSFVSAQDGLSAFETALKEIPDLIILDWNLPLMSGIEVLKNLKGNSSTQKIPVIIATGIMTNSSNLKTALEAGASDFIRKPADPVELYSRVKSVLSLTEEHKKTLLLEKEIFKQKEEVLLKEIQNKEKELISNSVQLALNNQLASTMISDIEKILKNFDDTHKKLADKIIFEFRKEIFKMNWNQFEDKFTELHTDFSAVLKSKFPDITPNEIKLCSLYRMNLSTTDISLLTFISYEGVRKARTRLRKKLMLGSETDLIQFLQSI